jgi:N-acetylmuramoyl-L-alanine amidase
VRGTSVSLIGLVLLSVMFPVGVQALQGDDAFRIRSRDSGEFTHRLVRHRGHPAVSAEALATTGWELRRAGDGWVAALPDGTRLAFRAGMPFVQLQGEWAQLAHPPYETDNELFLPLQLFTDLLPDRLPGRYRAVDPRVLELRDPGLLGAGSGPAEAGEPSFRGRLAAPATAGSVSMDDGTRVVVIDPGHGGRDPGAMGPRRTREKDVALAVALALAEDLREDPSLEVHLTRDDDSFIPIWERGEIATRLRRDRPGVFISIHANSWNIRSVRGVETYFLSEARTEHEARVAALENSATELEQGRGGPDTSELGFIIGELLNLDFQHWSHELASGVQDALADVHPGPDRGVKQAPLAVLTNAMMPSVLIELGFITNPTEEQALSRKEFQEAVAEATAVAVRDFFDRYPPGSATTSSR